MTTQIKYNGTVPYSELPLTGLSVTWLPGRTDDAETTRATALLGAGVGFIQVATSGGSGVTDGSKVDITISNAGTTYTVNTNAISTSKIADGAVATAKLADGAATSVKLGGDITTVGKAMLTAADAAAQKTALALAVTDVSGAAPLNSPVFTNVPAAPTAAYGTSTTQIATTSFVQGVTAVQANSVTFTPTTIVSNAITMGKIANKFVIPTSGADQTYSITETAAASSDKVTTVNVINNDTVDHTVTLSTSVWSQSANASISPAWTVKANGGCVKFALESNGVSFQLFGDTVSIYSYEGPFGSRPTGSSTGIGAGALARMSTGIGNAIDVVCRWDTTDLDWIPIAEVTLLAMPTDLLTIESDGAMFLGYIPANSRTLTVTSILSGTITTGRNFASVDNLGHASGACTFSAFASESTTGSGGTGTYILGTNVAVTLQDTGDTVTKTSHGLANGQIIRFLTIVTTTGISTATDYFVITATTNTFQVSLTSGGAAVALTTDGSGTITYGPSGTIAFGTSGTPIEGYCAGTTGAAEAVISGGAVAIPAGLARPGGKFKFEVDVTGGAFNLNGTYRLKIDTSNSNTNGTLLQSFNHTATTTNAQTVAGSAKIRTTAEIQVNSNSATDLGASNLSYVGSYNFATTGYYIKITHQLTAGKCCLRQRFFALVYKPKA